MLYPIKTHQRKQSVITYIMWLGTYVDLCVEEIIFIISKFRKGIRLEGCGFEIMWWPVGLLQQIKENKGLRSSARLKITACLTVIVGVSMREDIISCNTPLVNSIDPFFFPQMLFVISCFRSSRLVADYMQICHKRCPFLWAHLQRVRQP